MALKNYSNLAANTILTGALAAGATSLNVNDAAGYPTVPFTIRVGGLAPELILVGAKSGTTFSSLTRGYGGTSDVLHAAGEAVQHVVSAEDVGSPERFAVGTSAPADSELAASQAAFYKSTGGLSAKWKDSGSNVRLGYFPKVYVARIWFNGASAPVLEELYNFTGKVITLARVGTSVGKFRWAITPSINGNVSEWHLQVGAVNGGFNTDPFVAVAAGGNAIDDAVHDLHIFDMAGAYYNPTNTTDAHLWVRLYVHD